MSVVGKPLPHLFGDCDQIGATMIIAESLQEGQFVLPGPIEDLAHQAVLAAEEKQQHPRAGTDGSGQRAQREIGKSSLEDIVITGLQQLDPAGRGG